MIWKNSIRALFFALVVICVSCSCERERMLPEVSEVKFVRYAADLSVSSKVLGESIGFNILLPADYLSSKEKRYPVVYMLHGFGDNRKSWNDQWLRVESKIEELEKKSLQSMIYVFPDGFNSYYSNTYDGKYKYMDMFINEFVPYIDKVYRTIPDKQHRAVIGYSMGGFGAMVLPMKNPDVFGISVPLSMSFRTNEQYTTEGPQSGWDGQWGRIFGGIGLSGEARLTDYYKSHCPYYQFVPENKENLSELNLFLHCGDDEEQLLIANDQLHVQLREYGYAHEYRVDDGAHTSSYWRNALDEVLPYVQFVMDGGQKWEDSSVSEVVPEVSLDVNGVYVSGGKIADKPTDENVIYFAYENLSDEYVRGVISILADTGKSESDFMIVPCDLSAKNIKQWLKYVTDTYGVGCDVARRSIIAIGSVGEEVFPDQQMFSSLYFDNASIPLDDLNVYSSKFYYIGQTDDGKYYKEIGALYKTCKISNANFQYRVRNSRKNEVEDLYIGIKTISTFINY